MLALQTAIYDRLRTDAMLTAKLATYSGHPAVFDEVPQVDDPSDNSLFPYVVIGDDTASPFDTDTEVGTAATVTIHVWSRSCDFAQTKDIQQAIYNRLHRQDFTISGYALVGCDLEFEEAVRDADEVTRHGVQRFRIVFEEE